MVPVNQAALDTKIVPEPFRDRHKRKGITNAQESEHSVDKNAVEFIQEEVPKPEYASTSTSTTTSVGEKFFKKFFKGWGSLFDVADAPEHVLLRTADQQQIVGSGMRHRHHQHEHYR